MSTTLKDLIEHLRTTPVAQPDDEVEFVVVKKDGQIVGIDVSTQVKPIIKALKGFTS